MITMNHHQSAFLTLLRVAAAEIVVIGHGLSFFKVIKASFLQNSAVIIFFILSGILIFYTTNLKKNSGGYSFKAYAIDRFFRIYTGLVPSLLFIVLFDFIRLQAGGQYPYSAAFDLKTFIGNLFMLQDSYEIFYFKGFIINNFSGLSDLLFITSFGSGRPLWTLAIEWWLYLAFGYMFFILKERLSVSRVLVFFILMLIPAWNMVAGRGNGLALVWVFGGLISLLVFNGKFTLKRDVAYFSAAISIIFMFITLLINHEAYNLIYMVFMAFFVFFILMAMAESRGEVSKKGLSFLETVGGYSLTLYLTHYTILDYLSVYNGYLPGWALLLAGFVIANLVAWVLAMFTEMRYKELRRWFKARYV